MKRGIPDILILDIALGDKSGIEIAEMYKDKYPGISIMMLSMYMSDDFIFQFPAGRGKRLSSEKYFKKGIAGQPSDNIQGKCVFQQRGF